MRIALYARVSKDEADSRGRLQDPDNQLVPLRKAAKAFDWEVVGEYVDRVSGGNSNRPAFIKLRSEIRQKHIQAVYVWSLDRFSREGISNTMAYIKEMKRYGCHLISHTETWIDTRNEGVTELMLSIMAWVAQQERIKISERTKAGLARARREGRKLGRPKKKAPLEAL